MKNLLLLRHANASSERSRADHERPLDGRGREEAEAMGRHVAARGFDPATVLSSTARRAQETLALVLPDAKGVELRDDLYLASAARLFETIAALPGELPSVLLVGHNPGIGELCVHLAANGPREQRARLMAGAPPCALAAFGFEADDWAAALERRGELIEFTRPCDLTG